MMSKEVELQIQAVIDYIQTQASEVRVEQRDVIYQDEDANLDIYPPLSWDEERCLDFQEQISSHLVDVLLDSGYLILIYVYTPEQQIAKARRELARTQRRQVQIGQFLGQAAALGLA